MIRTKSPTKPKLIYPIEEEPIVLSKPLLDKLLAESNPADLIALYCFYYYTAKWQGTNQPKTTIAYSAKGLHWGEDRVRRVKKALISLGLVEAVVERGEGNRVTGHFIKVNFIWKDSTLSEIPRVEIPKANALSTNNKKEKNNKKVELQQFLKLFPKEWQDNHTFQNSLEDFTIHRRQKGSLLTPIARNRIANKLIKHDLQIAVEALRLSVENGWTGVFPESIKPISSTPKKSPKEIVYEYFKGKKDKLYIESFYKTYCKNAEDLLADRSDGQCSVLAKNMMTLHQWIDENQTNIAKENPVIPNASVLLGYYVDWLEKQNWLTIEPRHFTPNDKIFRSKFLTWENDYIGLNVMTGKF